MLARKLGIHGAVVLTLLSAGCTSFHSGIVSTSDGQYKISGTDKLVFSGDAVKTDLMSWAERFCGSQIEKRQPMKTVVLKSQAKDFKPGVWASAEITFKCAAPEPIPPA